MQNSMVMFSFYVFDRIDAFCTNLVKKNKIAEICYLDHGTVIPAGIICKKISS